MAQPGPVGLLRLAEAGPAEVPWLLSRRRFCGGLDARLARVSPPGLLHILRWCSARRDSQVVLMGPMGPVVPQGRMSGFAGYVVNRLFAVGLKLESARSITGDGPAGDRVGAATDEVDQLINDIRVIAFNSPADSSSVVALRECMARSARELQARALDAAALLERRADIAGQPSRLDYRTEIKRWLALAEQAEQMARRWERP